MMTDHGQAIVRRLGPSHKLTCYMVSSFGRWQCTVHGRRTVKDDSDNGRMALTVSRSLFARCTRSFLKTPRIISKVDL